VYCVLLASVTAAGRDAPPLPEGGVAEARRGGSTVALKLDTTVALVRNTSTCPGDKRAKQKGGGRKHDGGGQGQQSADGGQQECGSQVDAVLPLLLLLLLLPLLLLLLLPLLLLLLLPLLLLLLLLLFASTSKPARFPTTPCPAAAHLRGLVPTQDAPGCNGCTCHLAAVHV
jgi:hypothetical protein